MTEVNGGFISWIGKLAAPKKKEKELSLLKANIHTGVFGTQEHKGKDTHF